MEPEPRRQEELLEDVRDQKIGFAETNSLALIIVGAYALIVTRSAFSPLSALSLVAATLPLITLVDANLCARFDDK